MKKINNTPEIAIKNLAELSPAAYNPREISPESERGLKNSLEKFGLLDLLVINKRNNRIISGHQRYKIMKNDGIETAPCVVVDLDEIQEMALNLTLNSTEITGLWTNALIAIADKLRNQMGDEYLDLRLDILRDKIAEIEPETIELNGETMPDDIPQKSNNAITKTGDLWILGDHRLLCGDSLKKIDVARLMGEQKARLMATDPPYCVNYTGADRPNNGGKDWSNLYHENNIVNAKEFYIQILKIGMDVISKKTPIYIWHAERQYKTLMDACDELNILLHQNIIWVKPRNILSYAYYAYRHEPCALMWVRGMMPKPNVEAKKIGTVWECGYNRASNNLKEESDTDLKKTEIEHPTVKPTEIFEIPMKMHTKQGEICYEPFSGSGTQIIAGERLKRRVFAIEIEPVFCDVAVKRWEHYTGKKAEREK